MKESGERSLVPVAVIFEFSLAGVAILLGWLVGVNPFQTMTWRDPIELAPRLAWGVVAVFPMLPMLGWVRTSPLRPLRELRERLHEHILPHFVQATRLEVAWVALAAGVGEELLFRGFLQTALADRFSSMPLGGAASVILASLLFGLAHCVTWSYFGLATGVGIYFGLIFEASESLWVPVTAHAVYDFIALSQLKRDHEKKRAT